MAWRSGSPSDCNPDAFGIPGSTPGSSIRAGVVLTAARLASTQKVRVRISRSAPKKFYYLMRVSVVVNIEGSYPFERQFDECVGMLPNIGRMTMARSVKTMDGPNSLIFSIKLRVYSSKGERLPVSPWLKVQILLRPPI